MDQSDLNLIFEMDQSDLDHFDPLEKLQNVISIQFRKVFIFVSFDLRIQQNSTNESKCISWDF